MFNGLFNFTEPGTIAKAIAGGLIALVVAELARYGFRVSGVYTDAVGVLLTGVISYIIGHIAVYFAPANKAKVQ